MAAVNAVTSSGVLAFNTFLNQLGMGENLVAGIKNSNNADLGRLTQNLAVTGNGLQVSSSLASMFTVASGTLTTALGKVNIVGQFSSLASDISQATQDIQNGGSISNGTLTALSADVSGLVSTGLLTGVSTALESGATGVLLVGGVTLALPEALAIAGVLGVTSLVLNYAGLLSPGNQNAITNASNIFANTKLTDASSNIGIFLPEVVVTASSNPDVYSISSDGKTVTETWSSTLESYTEARTYTDSTRSVLSVDTTTEANFATN